MSIGADHSTFPRCPRSGSNTFAERNTRLRLGIRPRRDAATTCAGVPALKEWLPAVAALESGDQTVLFRKGGIREPAFTPAAPAFLLFPTAFHTDAQLLKPWASDKYRAQCAADPRASPMLALSCWAEVTGAWTTTDTGALPALHPLHIHGDAFLEARLRWRPKQPITILELRAYRHAPAPAPARGPARGPPSLCALRRGHCSADVAPALGRRLREAMLLPSRDEYWGCFSWVQLEAAGPAAQLKERAVPALDDDAFAARQRELRGRLAELEDLRALAPRFAA